MTSSTSGLPPNEQARLQTLAELEILDTSPEADYDDVTRLAAQICGTPTAVFSFVDAERQWFKSKVGTSLSGTSRAVSFCSHTILGPDILVVPDASADGRFRDNPLVTGESHIRFYAGVPLRVDGGRNVGTLCVLDRVVRTLSPENRFALGALGRQAERLLEDRLARARTQAQARQQLDSLTKGDNAIITTSPSGMIQSFNAAAERMLGYPAAEVVGHLTPAAFHDADELVAHAAELTRELGREIRPDFAVLAALAARRRLEEHEWTGCRRDGSRFKVLVYVTPLRDKPGDGMGFLVVMSDLTGSRNTAREVEYLLQELRGMKQAIDQHVILPLTDAHGKILSANDKFCAISGYTREELLGQDHRLVNSGFHSKEFMRDLWTTIQQGRTWRGDVQNRAKDGSIYWVDTTIVPFPDQAGQPHRFLAIRTDITERVTLNHELAWNHECITVLAALGRNLAETTECGHAAEQVLKSADKLVGWDASWLYAWNEREKCLEEVRSYDRREGKVRLATPQPPRRLKLTDDLARLRNAGTQYLSRPTASTPLDLPDPCVAPHMLSFLIAPLWSDGSFVGLLSVQSRQADAYGEAEKNWFTALADQAATALEGIQSHAAISTSERQLRVIWENAPYGLQLVDAAGRVLRVNDAFCALVGKSPEELVGHAIDKRFVDLLAHSPPPPVGSQGSQPQTIRLTLPDGSHRDLEVITNLVEMEAGAAPLQLSRFRNITQELELERQQRHNQRLEAIGTLAGGVAHDLNNALAPIMMSLETLREDHPEEAELLDMLTAGARRARDMARQLLTYAKGAEGRRVPLELAPVAREMDKIIKRTFPKNIRSRLELADNTPPVLADATQLHQLLLNLCVNARDAMPEGGTITIATGVSEFAANELPPSLQELCSGSYAFLRVIDTGTGIAPEVLRRIFDPFFTTKGPDKGTGLGLSTTQGIVHGHGGFLTVDSELGRGSTFTAYLPPSKAADTSFIHAVPDRRIKGDGRKVLYVDDEEPIRLLASALLKRQGFVPVLAVDGKDGLMQAMAHKDTLCAIITDMNMPGMDGLALVTTLRTFLPRLPVILSSGRLEDGNKDEFQRLKGVWFLSKPYTSGDFHKLLQESLATDPFCAVI